MNTLDIFFIIPMIWFAYRGFVHGIIIELASIAGVILGIWIGAQYSGYASGLLTEHFAMHPRYTPAASFIITFLFVGLIIYLVGLLITRIVDITALGFVNKLAGALFGVCKSILLLSILLMIIGHLNPASISQQKKDNSALYPLVSPVAPFLWKNLNLFRLPGFHNQPPNDSSGDTFEAYDGSERKPDDQSRIAAMPGNVFPSIYSSIAPPPVET
jgi:membrane protein required for colicin V production